VHRSIWENLHAFVVKALINRTIISTTCTTIIAYTITTIFPYKTNGERPRLGQSSILLLREDLDNL